jgi:hypothetical protein
MSSRSCSPAPRPCAFGVSDQQRGGRVVGWCVREVAGRKERNKATGSGRRREKKDRRAEAEAKTRKQNGGASAFQLEVGDGRGLASGAQRDACVSDSGHLGFWSTGTAPGVRGAAAVAEPPKRRLLGAPQLYERLVRHMRHVSAASGCGRRSWGRSPALPRSATAHERRRDMARPGVACHGIAGRGQSVISSDN